MSTRRPAVPSLLARIRYRVGQFFSALAPRIAADERAVLTLWLPAGAIQLFQRMPARDRRHSLNVFYQLRAAGVDQPDLLAAALLHDVGKTVNDGRPLRLWHRPLIVLAEALQPGLVERLARSGPGGWRNLFYVHHHHPEIGARLAEEAGCSNLTAQLIRRHQAGTNGQPASDEDRLLLALQLADDAS